MEWRSCRCYRAFPAAAAHSERAPRCGRHSTVSMQALGNRSATRWQARWREGRRTVQSGRDGRIGESLGPDRHDVDLDLDDLSLHAQPGYVIFAGAGLGLMLLHG
jgi:hypothetical protein